METVNVHEIRARLKHGDIAIIANKCHVQPRQVAEVLNKGREAAGIYDEVVSCALDLLKSESEQKKGIVTKAKEAGFSTDSFKRSDYRKKRKIIKLKEKPGGVWKVIGWSAAGVIAFLFLGGAKLFAKER